MSCRSLLCVAAAAVSLAAGTACDDPLGPEDVVGTYVLRTVRGESLPVVRWETATVTARLVADTLRLRRDGTGTETSVYELTGDVDIARSRTEQDIQFEIRDGRLEGGYVCRGLCLGVFVPIRGVFTAEGLRLDEWGFDDGPIEFERVE